MPVESKQIEAPGTVYYFCVVMQSLVRPLAYQMVTRATPLTGVTSRTLSKGIVKGLRGRWLRNIEWLVTGMLRNMGS